MLFFKTKPDTETPKKITQLNLLLQHSFQNVKRDTVNIFHWLQFMYKKTQLHDQQLQHLASQITALQIQVYNILSLTRIISNMSFTRSLDMI